MDDLCSCLFPSPLPCTNKWAQAFEGCKNEISSSNHFLRSFSFALLVNIRARDEAPLLQLWCPAAYRGKEDSSQFQLIFRWHGEGNSCCRNKHILWRHFLTLQKENTFTTRTSAFVVQEMSKSSVIPASAIKPGVFGENPRKLPGGWFTFCPQTVTQFSVPSNPYKSIKY